MGDVQIGRLQRRLLTGARLLAETAAAQMLQQALVHGGNDLVGHIFGEHAVAQGTALRSQADNRTRRRIADHGNGERFVLHDGMAEPHPGLPSLRDILAIFDHFSSAFMR